MNLFLSLGSSRYISVNMRTKEIGICKVLGSAVSGIVGLLSREFIGLVLVANIIAWPIAHFVSRAWLKSFVYRININSQFGYFIAAAVLALLIAWMTVSFQAVKAALANPVDSLRYE